MIYAESDVMATTQWEKALENLSRVMFCEGNEGLPKLEINTPWSSAEIYLHGAHVTHFQRQGESPLLFMSEASSFKQGAAIRGGIPIIFPWFGPREGQSAHGFARTQNWNIREISQLTDGDISLRFCLPASPAAASFPEFSAEYTISVGKALTATLTITNRSADRDLTFENCLHTYFQVGDIREISITGLNGVDYLDKTDGFARKTETAEQAKISRETDRVYLGTVAPIEIHDPKLDRRIRIEKSGSLSTVVWNPWVEKAKAMADVKDDEYQRMVCVESGNVGDNRITLPAGEASTLQVEFSALAL